MSTLSSQYHIEVTPSEAGTSNRIVIMTIIKEIAESAPLHSSGQQSFKLIIFHEVDELTREAEQALRRTMEKYMRTCRLILTANTNSQIIDLLRSRCLGFRIPLPSANEVVGVLNFVAKKEGLQLPLAFAEAIVRSSEGNLRRAILSLEEEKYPFTADQAVTPPRITIVSHQLRGCHFCKSKEKKAWLRKDRWRLWITEPSIFVHVHECAQERLQVDDGVETLRHPVPMVRCLVNHGRLHLIRVHHLSRVRK